MPAFVHAFHQPLQLLARPRGCLYRGTPSWRPVAKLNLVDRQSGEGAPQLLFQSYDFTRGRPSSTAQRDRADKSARAVNAQRGDPDHQRDQEVDHDLGIRSQENRERFGPHPGHGLSLTARGHTRYYVRREESTKWAKRSAAPPNARPLPPNAVIPSEPQRPPLVARPAQAPMTIPGMMTARRAGTSRACGLRSISRHRATPQFGDRLVTLLATL
jgi:hypothetical protein